MGPSGKDCAPFYQDKISKNEAGSGLRHQGKTVRPINDRIRCEHQYNALRRAVGRHSRVSLILSQIGLRSYFLV